MTPKVAVLQVLRAYPWRHATALERGRVQRLESSATGSLLPLWYPGCDCAAVSDSAQIALTLVSCKTAPMKVQSGRKLRALQAQYSGSNRPGIATALVCRKPAKNKGS